MRPLIILTGLVLLLSSCEDIPVCAPAPANMEILPDPLTKVTAGRWTLGPYTQGRLAFTVKQPVAEQEIILYNRGGDSALIQLGSKTAFLPKQDSFSLDLQWNLDAGLISAYRGETLSFQQILPFYDDLGVHSVVIHDEKHLRLDSLVRGSLIQDPADIVLAYWGNSLNPDYGPIARPWNAQVVEQMFSQGTFVRIKGLIPTDANGASPAIASLTDNLAELLSQRPAFVVVAAGIPEERETGGAGIPAFREEMTDALALIAATNAKAVVLILPPPASASLAQKDLRDAYNMELRTIAVNAAASVVDLSDRFQSPENTDKILQSPAGDLTQAGHDLLANELSTLLQYFTQFGG